MKVICCLTMACLFVAIVLSAATHSLTLAFSMVTFVACCIYLFMCVLWWLTSESWRKSTFAIVSGLLAIWLAIYVVS